jgi:hypothetical protein
MRILAFLFLLLSGAMSAADWKSSDFKVKVSLPDGEPRINPWKILGGDYETTLIGSRKPDLSAFVFLGIYPLKDKPKFQLTEKTVEEIDQRFFGEGVGFRRSIQPVTVNGVRGYRVRGSHYYNSSQYAIVVDMYQANGRIYQVAGAKTFVADPLRDQDIKWFMNSFRLLR